jgi:hypothetical protein
LVIAENGGEVIRPHPRFRVFATGNSAGAGDSSGLYQGGLKGLLTEVPSLTTTRDGHRFD